MHRLIPLALILLGAAFGPASAQTETAELQATLDSMSQKIADLEAQSTAQQVRIKALEDAPAPSVGIKWPRHGLVRINGLPDPYPVECATVTNTAVTCDPTANVTDMDEDLITWDTGQCANGTLTLVSDVPTYTPPAGFTGTDTCTADVRDDAQYALEAEITVTVAAP